MATRPVVLVYQELATLSTTPATAELNVCITGPAYWIQDFPEDRASIKLAATYGNRTASATTPPPVANVVAVGPVTAPNNKVGAVLDTASVRVFLGAPHVALATGTDGVSAANSVNYTSAGTNFQTAGVRAGDLIVLTNGSSSTITRRVRTVTGTALTFVDEVPTAGYVSFRVERELADAEIPSNFITVSGGLISVLGGVQLAVAGVAKDVVSADVYVSYRSLRTDLQTLQTISDSRAIRGQIGRIDARNPLATGVFVALQNTNTAVQYYGVNSDTLTGYMDMLGSVSGRKDIYAVVPLTQNLQVIAAFKNEFEQMADVDYALENGVPQKFRVVIGAPGTLPETKEITETQTDGQVPAVVGTLSTYHTLTLTGADLIAATVRPGDTVVISDDEATTVRNGTYTVSQVIDADTLEVVQALSGAAQSATATVVVNQGTTSTPRLASAERTVATLADSNLVLELVDSNATFIDDGVMATDFIEMPSHHTATTFAVSNKYEIAEVVSNQRLRIKNNGRNTDLIVNELPHGVSRSAPFELVPSTNLRYRVVRTLTKDGQVEELMAIPQSLLSRRAVICWPDQVDVASLVDGSLPRDPSAPDTASPANTQPGFYLACAVGGMTAGLPSHQGFTNLGIAGIDRIYHANNYFSDKQITDLSNAGWFVFQQDTPQALPYVVHQLTTDPATLQFGEFSMVKNFDLVSMEFSDVLDDFIGVWNMNKETYGFVQAAVQARIDNLLLRKRPRIGAPINDARITSLGESPISEDRLELYVEADFPKPLNTVGLHIVSV